ncbi:MAG: GxxExxY protein [Ignavibacteriales bacterium]|nr:GxxExxY protein [Ignavibacteriales bacterium]
MESKAFEPIDERTEQLAKIVIDCAFKVFIILGPGLLESVYETCLCHELAKRGINFKRQVSIPIVYDNIKLDEGLRIDILVEDTLVVELKAVEAMNPVFQSQLITYLKLTKKRLGLLINFNVPNFKKGVKRIIL